MGSNTGREESEGDLTVPFYPPLARDGMIKRPGNEHYLSKIIEEERKAYVEVLDLEEEQDASK